MNLTAEAQAAFREHVLSEYPKEACGLIVQGEFVPSTNVAADPLTSFKIDPLLLVEHSGNIEAVLHSHPYDIKTQHRWDPRWPSTADMQNWMLDTIPWGIVSTEGEGSSHFVWMDDSKWDPLEGREFVHGVNDCYSLVRDYFREVRDVVLPNYARGIEWWNNGQDLYSQNFAAAGFIQIDRNEVVPGDCCLFQVRSPVVNHAAVITGPDEILHHMFHRLSHKDSLRRWEKQIVRYVRYVPPTKAKTNGKRPSNRPARKRVRD
jgi:cell wall-associated NlpC family hydrolase